MANWTNEPQPFGPNHAPLLEGLSSVDGKTPVPVAVDPATGSILTAGGSAASSVAINDGLTTARKATVAALTNSNPLAVEIVDATGTQITSFGGGTQYQELATTAPGTGTLSIGRYKAAPPILTDNQLYGLQLDASGNLKVNSSGVTSKVDIADTLNNPISAFPATFLRTTDEPHQLFYDPFDATLDVTNRWTSSQGSSGVAASTTTGVMSLGTGTVANGYSKLISQPIFTLPIPAWLGISDAITIPDLAAPTANAYRFWGVGTTPTTPTATAPLTDAVGFELATTGKMYAVVWAGGTRTVIQDLSTSGNSTQPTDANPHRYICYIRTDKAYWYIDGITSAQLVATSNFQSPQVQTLPKLFLAVGGATPPGSNSQIQCTGATAWDTGKNNAQLSDGTFPWRKASISAAGAISTAITAALPAGTNTLGGVEITNGTNIADVIAGDTGQNSLAIVGNRKEVSFTTTTAAMVAVTDVSNYRWVSVHIVTQGTLSNVAFQVSNDNTNWVNTALITTNVGTTATLTTNTTGAGSIFHGSLTGRYFRLNVTAITAGTTAGVVEFSSLPGGFNQVNALVAPNGATGSAVPANAFYKGLLAQTANPSAATPGNMVGALSDKLGKQIVVGSVRELKVNQTTTITSSTAETTVLTSSSGNFLDVYGVMIANTSATALNVAFKDSTAGTTQFTIEIPAGDTRGFMLPEGGAVKQTTVTNNWTATCSASVASAVITMLAVKNI